MNFLAHLALADHHAAGDAPFIAGNLFGDFIKGPLTSWEDSLSPRLLDGARMHRRVDEYMDTHPNVLHLQTLFSPPYRRVSGIALDVLFDHCLSVHWQHFYDEPLADFAARMYQYLSDSANELDGDLGSKCQTLAQRLEHHNGLQQYHRHDHLEFILNRIGERFKQGNLLQGIMTDIDAIDAEIMAAFLNYWPQASQHFK